MTLRLRLLPSALSLVLVLALAAIGCGQDDDTPPTADSKSGAADTHTSRDAGARQDTSPQRDGASPKVDANADGMATPDAAPADTIARPDHKTVVVDSAVPDAPPPCNTALEGSFSAPFSLEAVEKLGSIVINKMACSGTLTAKLSCSQKPVLQGSYSCIYGKGLTLFDKNQSGTIEAAVASDGKLSGKIKHRYNSSLTRSYSVGGDVAGGKLSGKGQGSVLPHPSAAVAWKVTFSF